MNSNKNDIEKLKMKIAIFNTKEDIKNRYLQKNNEKKGVNLMKKKIIATACASLVLVSGIVLAANIENIKTHFRGLGKGVDTAVENGYIQNIEMDFQKFDNMGTEVKIENFFMDDLNLSVKFSIKFDNNIKNAVDLDKVTSIDLTDLIIRDEENRIIFGGYSKETFDEYCKENNLNYEFAETSENYMNCGLNWFINKENENNINLTYNIYCDKFPKSKKLYCCFKTMTLHMFDSSQENEYKLNGNWKIELDVPEKMYNRTNEYYKVVSCSNKEFNIYTAMVTDTGFEIGIKIPSKNKKESIIRMSKTYIENEKGDKFKRSLSVSRNAKGKYLPNDEYDFYETFNMTKYDATDKVRVVLYYYGKPVNIELEKIK